MLTSRKILFFAVTTLSIIGYGVAVFALAPVGGYAPGETLDPVDCSPGDTDCKVKMFLATTLPGAIDVSYEHTDDFLDLGISGAGQVWDTGLTGYNILANVDSSGFGGSKNTTYAGYLTPGGAGAQANFNASYDDISDVSNAGITTSYSGGNSANINLRSNANGSSIRFTFSGGGDYKFPSTSPSVGEVLGYASANQLGWVTSGTSLTATHVGFGSPSGTLMGTSNFTWHELSKIFSVGDIALTGNRTRFILNDSNAQTTLLSDTFVIGAPLTSGYVAAFFPTAISAQIGDYSSAGNDTLFTVSDSTQIVEITGNFPGPANGNGFLVDFATQAFGLGDLDSAGNGTKLTIDDSDGQVFLGTASGNPNASFLSIDPVNGVVDLAIPLGYTRIGAPGGLGNGTNISVNDAANGVYSYSDQFRIINNAQTRFGFSIDITNGDYAIGDIFGAVNSTKVSISDADLRINNVVDGFFNVVTSSLDTIFSVYTPTSSLQMGDVGNTANKTTFAISDTAKTINSTLDGVFTIQSSASGATFSSDQVNFLTKIGDVTGLHNGTLVTVDDANSRILLDTTGLFEISNGVGAVFRTDIVNNTYSLGDLNVGNNGTYLVVDDASQKISFYFNGPDSYSFPTGDSLVADWVLATDAAGQIRWADPAVLASDASLKSNIRPISYGLETLLQLNPVSYTLDSSGDQQIGFIAQEVEPLVPELIGTVSDGKKGLKYGQLTSIIVKAVQDLDLKVTDIENFATAENKTFLNNLIAWFADAANGITDLFADRVSTHELCIDDQCLNQDDVRQLLELKNQFGVPAPESDPEPNPNPEPESDSDPEPSPTPESTPEVIPDVPVPDEPEPEPEPTPEVESVPEPIS